VLQPLQIRAFAKLHLRRAKSDRIDAVLIAACTHVLDPQARRMADPRLDALTDQLTFIEHVEADIVRLKTRLEHIGDARLRDIVTSDIERLQTRRADELERLIAALRDHADLARRFVLVLSVPGIGERTALALILRMPELGQVSREQAAALAASVASVAIRELGTSRITV
jgi:transposase